MPFRTLVDGGHTRNMYPTIVSFGGGLDSTALLIHLHLSDTPVDSIVFAAVGYFKDFDGTTIAEFAEYAKQHGRGDEMPHTYDHLVAIDTWLRDHGMAGITVVTHELSKFRYDGLYWNCIANFTLPGIAFRTHSCSVKHKGIVIDDWVRANYPWAFRITRMIGYDAGCRDQRRAHRTFKIITNTARIKPHSYAARNDWVFPLIEAGWTREHCESVCRTHLGYSVKKSACFFCAATPLASVLQLGREYPQLARQCVEMEAVARPWMRDPNLGLSGKPTKRHPGRWTNIWREAGLLERIMKEPLPELPFCPMPLIRKVARTKRLPILYPA